MTYNDLIKDALAWAIERRSDMYCTYKVDHIEVTEETGEYKIYKLTFSTHKGSKFETGLRLHTDGRREMWQVGTRHTHWLEEAASFSMMMAREIKEK